MTTTTKALTYALAGAALALGLGACGSATGSAAAAGSTATGSGSGAPAARGGGFDGGGQLPGASGLIAAVSGTTLQVQDSTQQTAVTYTSSTRITDQVRTTAAALKVGDCVTARPARSSATATTRPTTIEAATVQVIPSTNGSCVFGGNGVAGNRPVRVPTGIPTPSGTRTFGGNRTFGGFGAYGTVASLGSGSFTMAESTRPSSTGSSPPPRTIVVTYAATTVFETTRPVTAAAIKVGECARALGTMDDTGAIAATSLALSPATNGSCRTGFGGRRGA